MQKRVTTAHLILIVTFGLYMGFQWCAQKVFGLTDPVIRIVMAQLVLVLPGLCWMLYQKVDFKEMFSFRTVSSENLKMAVLVLILSYPSIMMLNLISMLFVQNAMSSVISSLTSLGPGAMLFVMAVMPAFDEEFLCRGILYHAYRPVSKAGGVVLSALIFGLLHLNFNQMPYAFYIGIVFALMVEATGSIYTSMVMHFLLNGFNAGMNYLAAVSGAMTTSESQITAVSDMSAGRLAGAIAVLVIFTILTALAIIKTFKMNGRTMKTEKKEKGLILDVWIIIFIGFALFLTVVNTVYL
jgi:membrane protease YdiL (CAAX protease family)